ncbi:hypothetical protein CMT41_03790 [Colwellia sp. MT41]|uniref:Uncharacterized protein n=1 Tax=Colwellia marinimaniae TaxID=1513592 RepID=A0ABQ0MYF5_9GAMM|nr:MULTISPECIES: hypothetical protein [Colwellia]ALO33946.1 hypothetical protein CMT41_03790 [Colwellia sp. MT41]GAW97398.1 hypothetical protein MTCD1_03025 [Colwellia marinimaniae]
MHAMLSLDLDKKTSTEQREKFYAHIRDSGWMTLAKVTTTWFTCYRDSVTEARIIAEVKQDVAAAAKYSGVTSYDAVVNVSQSKPSSF